MIARYTFLVPAAVLAVSLGLPLVGCGGLRAVDTRPQLLDQARAPGVLRAAVVRALERSRFGAEQERPGTIIARYARGDRAIRVRVDYTATSYEVHLLDHDGYDFETDPATGVTLVDFRITRALTRVERGIDRQLRLEDRRQMDAIQQQRQHEVNVAAASSPTDGQPMQSAPAPAQPSTGERVMSAVFGLAAAQAQQAGPTASFGVSQQSFHCCINGAYYACPGRDAFRQCSNRGPAVCTRQPSSDSSC